MGELELFIPMSGLIDTKAESARLNKEIEKISKDLQLTQNKLANANYVEKAPAALVKKERQRLIELQSSLVKLEQQLVRLKEI